MKRYKCKDGTILSEKELENWYKLNQAINQETNDFTEWLMESLTTAKLEEMHGMKINIDFELYTDGDYALYNPKAFEAELSFEVYEGHKVFEVAQKSTCQMYAREYLENFLCDGIRVIPSHYELLGKFYDMINECIVFIYNYGEETTLRRELSGNYDGTYISVKIEEY